MNIGPLAQKTKNGKIQALKKTPLEFILFDFLSFGSPSLQKTAHVNVALLDIFARDENRKPKQ